MSAMTWQEQTWIILQYSYNRRCVSTDNFAEVLGGVYENMNVIMTLKGGGGAGSKIMTL